MKLMTVGFVLFWTVLAVSRAATPDESSGLAFHLAIRDRATYERDSRRYERVERSTVGAGDVYVEKSPRLTLPLNGITAVRVEKRRIHANVTSVLEEIAGRGKPPAAGEPHYFFAALTFDRESQEKFKAMASKYDGEWVDVRLNGRRLATVQLRGSFASGEPGLRLSEQTQEGVRRVLEPLKQRTQWP